ncbi:MAG: PIG-L family deacetylase [Lachnospiraceae bacterium]|nr:PIG-L family deacetylase [Lachnospiraceae bacterium]
MNKRLMVISGHGADWCTRSAGTLIKFHDAGWDIRLLVLTMGARGESPEYWVKNPNSTVEACKETRRKEAQAAADLLGFTIEFLDYNDYPLVMNEERIREVELRVLDYRPDIVLTHSPGDPLNVDHEETYKAAIRAVAGASMIGALPNTPNHFVPDVYLFESSLPHSEFNEFRMDHYVDISDVMDRKMAAVACFECQPILPDYYTRCGQRRAEQATNWLRGRGTVEYAEGFKRYTPYVGKLLPFTCWD